MTEHFLPWFNIRNKCFHQSQQARDAIVFKRRSRWVAASNAPRSKKYPFSIRKFSVVGCSWIELFWCHSAPRLSFDVARRTNLHIRITLLLRSFQETRKHTGAMTEIYTLHPFSCCEQHPIAGTASRGLASSLASIIISREIRPAEAGASSLTLKLVHSQLSITDTGACFSPSSA